MAASEISLVRITSPFSGLGGFLYDHFETTMVGTCFTGKFHTLWDYPQVSSHLCYAELDLSGHYNAEHFLSVIVIEKDTFPLLTKHAWKGHRPGWDGGLLQFPWIFILPVFPGIFLSAND